MSILKSWILGLITASIAAALARALTPEGAVKKVVIFVCGVMMTVMLLSPALSLDRDAAALAMAEYRRTVWELTGDLESQEKQLLRTYIQEQCGAYIVDEARRLGTGEVKASVQVKWRDESWVPYEADVTGALTDEQRGRLSAWLETELGIPPERQGWHETE